MDATTNNKTIGNPVKAFYQEVVAGDLKKYENKSNTSKTGGGARDLRISPVSAFWEELNAFFPTTKTERERIGIISSKKGNKIDSVDAVLMRPTGSRKNECRICKIRTIKGWSISEEEYRIKTGEGHKWFFLLVLDDKNQVWASKFSSSVLEKMDAKIREPLKAQMKKYKGKKKTIRNIVNL